MPEQNTRELWRQVEAAKAEHDNATAAIDAAANWYQREKAKDRAITAFQTWQSLTQRWLTACAHDDTADAAERRVERAADIIAPALSRHSSESSIAWDLEEAGLLGQVRG